MQKKLRFTVFQKDNFTCQYCGRKPPKVVLEVDHILPRAEHGTDEIENLITSCEDCNRGKGKMLLTKTPAKVRKNIKSIEEKYEQLKAFYEYQNKISSITELLIDDIDDYWSQLWDRKYSLNIYGRASIKMFLGIFTKEEITDALYRGAVKVKKPAEAFKYACGILHNIKRRKELELHKIQSFQEESAKHERSPQ